jgi:hypothetical protein
VEREGKTGDPRAVPVVKFIDVIKSITMAMEKTQDFKMKDLKYSTERLTLQGTVPKVSSAEEIKKILEETGIFESINDPKVRKEMGRDTWVISIDARVSSKAKDK